MNWKKIVNKVFPLPFWGDSLFFLFCAAALIWVFVSGLENWWPAYALYALSAYCLTAVCIKLPDAIQGGKLWIQKHPKLLSVLKDEELKYGFDFTGEKAKGASIKSVSVKKGDALASPF